LWRGLRRLGFDFDRDSVFSRRSVSLAHRIGDVGDLGRQLVVEQISAAAQCSRLALFGHAGLVSEMP
jgi:hypothetical protein